MSEQTSTPPRGGFRGVLDTAKSWTSSHPTLTMAAIIVIVPSLVWATSSLPPDRALILYLWWGLMVHCLHRFRERIVEILFLIAFFILLIGRDTLALGWGYRRKELNPQALPHLNLSLILALVGLGLGIAIARYGWPRLMEWRRSRATAETAKAPSAFARLRASLTSPEGIQSTRSIALWLYWLTFIPTAIAMGIRVSVGVRYGYLATYTKHTSLIEDQPILVALEALMITCALALFTYLSTQPETRRLMLPLIAWIAYMGMSVIAGQRTTIITGTLTLLVWAIQRSKPAATARIRNLRIAAFAVVAVGMVAITNIAESMRGVSGGRRSGLFSPILDMLFNQGVSSTVIRNAYVNHDRMPDALFSLSFLKSGLIARLTGTPVHYGNTIEKAMDGSSFVKSLSLIVVGKEEYLQGHGTGSSYVAELWHDFNYPGVLIGSLIYGLILVALERRLPQHALAGGLKLLIMKDMFFAPRGAYSQFMATLLSPATLLGIALILGGTLALLWYRRRTRTRPTPSDEGSQVPA